MKKTTNIKIFIVFGAIILVSLILGFGVGLGIAIGDEKILDVIKNSSEFLLQNAQWFLVANFIFFFLSIIFLMQEKRLVLKIENENDEIYEKADAQLGASLSCSSIFMIVSFMTFSLGMGGPHIVPMVAIFLIQMLLATIIQYIVVEQTKKLNPEKKGNLLDTKFQKDWLSTCDEAETQKMGEAAYKSMVATQKTILILMVTSMILSLIIDNQFASIAIGTIWLVQTQSYLRAGKKLEKKMRQKLSNAADATP